MIDYIYAVTAVHNPDYIGEHPLSFKTGDTAKFTRNYIVRVHKLQIDSVTVTGLDIIVKAGVYEFAFCDFNRSVFLDEESANRRAKELWDDIQPDEWPDFRLNNKNVPWWYIRPPKAFWIRGKEYPVTGVRERLGNYYICSGNTETINPEFESSTKPPRKRPPSSVVYYRLMNMNTNSDQRVVSLGCSFKDKPLGILKEKDIPFDHEGRRYVFSMKRKQIWLVTDYETGLLVFQTVACSFEKAKAQFLHDYEYVRKATDKHDKDIEEISKIMRLYVPTIRKFVDSRRQS